MIELKNVSFAYGKQKTLEDVTCRMQDGQVTCLIGPNGAGKSTLLRLMARILKPDRGTILVDEKNAADYASKAFAQTLAFLPQNRPTPALSVRSLVALGRYSHGRRDQEAVDRAIETAGLKEIAHRDVRTLSGGQQQMAYLAMLLAQGSKNVLLDEPFTHLDIGAQLDAAQMILKMRDEGKCITVVMHDLGMLETVCSRAVLLDAGKITFDGCVPDCLGSAALENAFGVRVLKNTGVSFAKR